MCLGNICRSPAAEGAFRFLSKKMGRESDFEVDSAGTGSWHIGQAPDERSQAACLKAGFNISAHRGRQISKADFDRFDLILACDHENYSNLCDMKPAGSEAKVELLMTYAPEAKTLAIPDPYWSGAEGFDHAVKLCLMAAEGLLKRY